MLKLLSAFLSISIRTFLLILPTLIVIDILESKAINFDNGRPIVNTASPDKIDDILPRTRWGELESCNAHFNEIEEYEKALQCVNDNVYPENPISSELTIPRCFVIPAHAPDIFSQNGLNFIPLRTFRGVGAVVGFYDPPTRTIFIVENIDAASTYRHELQHLFLHINEPWTRGGGHFQDIWKKCEPPYYKAESKVSLIRELTIIYKNLD